jgi:hypothetical protein
VIVRKERPHPGAQLRFTDIGGHRFTAACGCAWPPPGPGPPSSPPRSPACKPSHPADQHQTAPATRKDKTQGPWNPAHQARQPGSQPRPGAEISKRPRLSRIVQDRDTSRLARRPSLIAPRHQVGSQFLGGPPGHGSADPKSSLQCAAYSHRRRHAANIGSLLKRRNARLAAARRFPNFGDGHIRFTYKSRWLKDLTCCGEFRKQNISICSVFARHDHPVLWYGGVLSRDRS